MESNPLLDKMMMYRNIRKCPMFTPATIVVFYEIDLLVSRVPDFHFTRAHLARRLNMSPDTIERAFKVLKQFDAIDYEANPNAGIVDVVINPKGKF